MSSSHGGTPTGGSPVENNNEPDRRRSGLDRGNSSHDHPTLYVISEGVPEHHENIPLAQTYDSLSAPSADTSSTYTFPICLSEAFSEKITSASSYNDAALSWSATASDCVSNQDIYSYDACYNCTNKQELSISDVTGQTSHACSSHSQSTINSTIPTQSTKETSLFSPHTLQGAAVVDPRSQHVKPSSQKSSNDKPWYCVTRPIHEQTRDIKISTRNKSSSINRSRLLAKCRSMLEYCSTAGKVEMSEANINELNFNHHWGDPLPKGVKGNTIRIVYQNVNKSLGATPTPATYSLLQLLKQMEADVFMASETNRNWRSPTCRNKLKQTVGRIWRNNRIAFSTSKVGEDYLSDEFLPGGTATMLFDHLATRTVQLGEDDTEMGRFSYATVEGQNSQKLTIITGYQICKGAMRGTTTSCMQQRVVINKKEMKAGRPTSNPTNAWLRNKFIDDLITFILQLKEAGHAIILALDANETISESLQNGSPKPGTIEYLLQQTGLSEVFQERHQHVPDSSTTTPGRFIDRVATWGVDLQRVTLLRANEPALSDHLAIVIDVSLDILFQRSCSQTATQPYRKLTSGNQDAVRSDVSFLKTQFHNHKIVERCERLKQAMKENRFEERHRRQLYALDKQVTEIMLGAENQCSKKTAARNWWSPELDQAGTVIKYWKCRVALNGHIDDGTLELGATLGIHSDHQQSLPLSICQERLNTAWKHFRKVQRRAREAREKHLRERAESHAAKGNGDLVASIRHIRRIERMKADYHSIRKAYGIDKQGLTTLDVPDQTTGGRMLITEKDEIHRYLLQRNEKHYSQATYTAFGEAGPGFPYINPDDPSSDEYIDEMLNGVFEPWETASPYVRELLAELQCTVQEELDTTLHLTDFIDLFKTIPEVTASSVSGLHYGHYRVLSKLDDLSFIQVKFDLVNIAFRTQSPLPRWRRSTQVMLEKGKGPGIENLRIIQLLEADMNWLLRFLWGRKLNHHALRADAFNKGQFALPGKLCGSAILNRVLYFDMLRQTRQCGALMDNDATAAFDRVLPALCVVTCRQLGMPKEAQRFFFRILRQMEFTVTTAHGTSTQTYAANANSDAPGQGVIQGGGASGPNYASQQHPVLKGVERNCVPAVFYHASRRRKPFKRWATGFADDISLLLNALGVKTNPVQSQLPMAQQVRDVLTENLSRYETYFSTVGGALNLKKCFYYLVDFVWAGTQWRYKTINEINLPNVTITPTTLDNSGSPQPLAWLEANDAQRTLGAHIAPDGSTTKQLDVLHGHFTAWKKALGNISTGNLQAKLLSYQHVFSRKIMFPLIGHSMSKSDLQMIQQPTDRELLHILGLNEHFPRAMLHASTTFGGLGCSTFHAQHVADKVILFCHHMKEHGEIAEVFQASMSFTQLECGASRPFFSLPANIWHDLVTPTWITHIWRECEPNGVHLMFYEKVCWVPNAQRENDFTIMDLAEQHYAGAHLARINQCRLFLQVTYLSDITSVDGRRILSAYYDGIGHGAVGRETRLHWPPVGRLPTSHWTLWREFLNRLFGTSLRLQTPLGGWYQDTEVLTRINFFLYERRLIMCRNNESFEFRPFDARTRIRFHDHPYPFSDHHLLQHASVVDIARRAGSIFVISRSSQIIVARQTTPPVNSLQDLYTTLPRSLQRLIGHINWPDEATTQHLAEAIRTGTAIGVSDGSVRASQAKATHAWILQAPNGAEIVGRGPVDGGSQARTSHRAELQGQAGLFLMVAMIVRFYQVATGHIATFCDNQPVVKKIQRGWEMLRLRHTKSSDTDLQITMRAIIETLTKNITYKTEWLRSHQDKHVPLHAMPIEVALNVRMDAETKMAYELPEEWHTNEFMDVLPAEGCAVYIDNRKITSRLHSTLLDKRHEHEARDYLLSRHDIDTTLFAAIKWRSMRFALLKLSLHRRATAVKAIHRHLPTQDKLFSQGRVTMCALCPRCVTHVETNAHVFSCTHTDALKQRLNDWGELQRQLVRINTATIIQRTWTVMLRPLLKLPPSTDLLENIILATHDDVQFCLQAAIEEQDHIGWDKLLLGMGSSLWQTLQSIIDHDNPRPPSRSADDWMNRAIHQMLKFSMRCWKYRNQTIHGATIKESKRKALDKARLRIKNIYENPPELSSQFRSITEVPLVQRLRLPLAAAEKWIALIDHQVKVTLHNTKLLLRSHKTIPEHFQRMAANRRNLPQGRVSPRRAPRRKVKNARPSSGRQISGDALVASQSVSSNIISQQVPRAGSPAVSRRRRRPPTRRHPP